MEAKHDYRPLVIPSTREQLKEEASSLSQLATQGWLNSPIFRRTPPSSPSNTTYENGEDANKFLEASRTNDQCFSNIINYWI